MNNSNNYSSIKALNYSLLMIYWIICVFFVFFSQRALVYPLQALLVIIPMVVKIYKDRAIYMSKSVFVFSIFIVGILICLFSFSDYSQYYMVKAIMPIATIYIYSKYGIEPESRRVENFFWGVNYLLCIIELILVYLGHDTIFEKLLFGDSNYRELIHVIFVLYSIKRGYKLGGVILLTVRMLLSPGRGTVLFLLIVLLFAILKKYYPRLINGLASILKRPFIIFSIQIILGIILVVFSYFWIRYIVPTGIVSYRTGLNDMSNQMRFNANLYAFDELITDRNLLLSGYGGELRDSILAGVNEEFIRYNGVVLVQPHSSILNLLMCMGWFPGLVYIFSWGVVFRRIVRNDNIGYFIAFMIYSLFLLIYPNNGIELFLAFLMIIPICRRNKHKLRFG